MIKHQPVRISTLHFPTTFCNLEVASLLKMSDDDDFMQESDPEQYGYLNLPDSRS